MTKSLKTKILKICSYIYISTSNVIWSCVPCTRAELCEIFKLKLSRKIYVRSFIYYVIFGCILYTLYTENVFILYFKFIQTEKPLIIFILNIFIYLILAFSQAFLIKYPDKGVENIESVVDESIIIVACHCSEDEIGKTVKSLIQIFSADRIFIADNGKTKEPADNTREIVINAGLPPHNYFYFPVPGKTSALLGVALEVAKTSLEFDYITLVDDDTILPDDFAINRRHFDDPNVAATTFGIQVEKRDTLVEACGDWDYKTWCWRNYWRSKWITLKFAVGILVVWRKHCFFKIYTQSPTRQPRGLPFGEDGHAGRIARMYGWKIRQDLNYTVSTYAPPILWPPCFNHGTERATGYGAVSMWKQRAYRWYRNYPRRILYEFYIILTYNCKPKPKSKCYILKLILKNIAYRIDYGYSWFLIFSAINLPTTLYISIKNSNYLFWLYLHLAFYVSGLISNYLFNYYVLRNRPDLKVSQIVLWVYPLFTTWIAMARAFGFLGGILYYIPFKAGKGSSWNSTPRGVWTLKDFPTSMSDLSVSSTSRYLSGLKPIWSCEFRDTLSTTNITAADILHYSPKKIQPDENNTIDVFYSDGDGMSDYSLDP